MLACGALAILVVLQLIMPANQPSADVSGLAARRVRPVTPPLVPEYAAILAAPLFAPDRQPGDAQSDAQPGTGSLQGYAAIGAASGAQGGAAVVQTPDGKVQTLKLGDDLAGWRLVGVNATALTLERSGARQQLAVGAPAQPATPPSVAVSEMTGQ